MGLRIFPNPTSTRIFCPQPNQLTWEKTHRPISSAWYTRSIPTQTPGLPRLCNHNPAGFAYPVNPNPAQASSLKGKQHCIYAIALCLQLRVKPRCCFRRVVVAAALCRGSNMTELRRQRRRRYWKLKGRRIPGQLQLWVTYFMSAASPHRRPPPSPPPPPPHHHHHQHQQ